MKLPLVCIGRPLKKNEVVAYLEEVISFIINRLTPIPKSILFVPPDITRLSSQAGFITSYLHRHLPSRIEKAVMPAIGLHRGMSEYERLKLFGDEALQMKFLIHKASSDAGNRVVGKLSRSDCEKVFGEKQRDWNFLWEDEKEGIEVTVNQELFQYDLILSIGQVMPHEIVGMANYHKNILVGVGGEDFINKSHFFGAMIGIPNIVGKTHNPIRDFFKLAYDRFIRPRINIKFLFTVIDSHHDDEKTTTLSEFFNLSGLFFGDSDEVYHQACSLSEKVNITPVSFLFKQVWVHMPSEKYRSLWLANKAIYRTHDIIEEDGELIIDAPGINCWGENKVMDSIISTYGYRSSEEIIELLKRELTQRVSQSNNNKLSLLSHLAVVAHLIHGYRKGQNTFVNYFDEIGKGRDFYEKVGFSSISKTEYEKRVLKLFKQDSMESLKHHKSLQSNDSYFINDAGLGFWKKIDE